MLVQLTKNRISGVWGVMPVSQEYWGSTRQAAGQSLHPSPSRAGNSMETWAASSSHRGWKVNLMSCHSSWALWPSKPTLTHSGVGLILLLTSQPTVSCIPPKKYRGQLINFRISCENQVLAGSPLPILKPFAFHSSLNFLKAFILQTEHTPDK